jgi:hypothetical protein
MSKRQCWCVECDGDVVARSTFFLHAKNNEQGDQKRRRDDSEQQNKDVEGVYKDLECEQSGQRSQGHLQGK